MLKIIIKRVGAERQEIELSRGTTRIGRHFDNDVRIDDITVSGHHAKIVWFRGPIYIQDTSSTNGTFINGQRVGQHDLEHGDVITLGSVNLLFMDSARSERVIPIPEPAHMTVTPADIDAIIEHARHPDAEADTQKNFLPEGIKWIAQDARGEWWGFERKPRRTAEGWTEIALSNFIKIGNGQVNDNWPNSLRKI